MAKIEVFTKGKLLSYSNSRNYIKYEKGKIKHIEDCKTIKTISLSNRLITRILSYFRLTSRILRLEPRTSINLSNNEILFSFNKSIYRYDLDKREIFIEHTFREGMNNLLYFTSYDINNETYVLYGEYFSNKRNEEVKIYKREKGLWSVAYCFPPNTILHVHNIVISKEMDYLYILSGDTNEQSAIWKADIDFNNVTRIVYGSQVYRSCFGYFTKTDFNYFMDSPLEPNYYLSLNNKSSELISISPMEGPVIFGYFKDNLGIVSTSVEPDSRLTGLRYLLTKKKGLGIKDNFAHLYSINELSMNKIGSFLKDIYPAGLFQFGTLMPLYISEQYILVYCIAIKKYDGKTIKIEMR